MVEVVRPFTFPKDEAADKLQGRLFARSCRFLSQKAQDQQAVKYAVGVSVFFVFLLRG
jgi:hypothetical protein